MFLFVELNSNECKRKDKSLSSSADNQTRSKVDARWQPADMQPLMLGAKCPADFDKGTIEMFTTSLDSKSNAAINIYGLIGRIEGTDYSPLK